MLSKRSKGAFVIFCLLPVLFLFASCMRERTREEEKEEKLSRSRLQVSGQRTNALFEMEEAEDVEDDVGDGIEEESLSRFLDQGEEDEMPESDLSEEEFEDDEIGLAREMPRGSGESRKSRYSRGDPDLFAEEEMEDDELRDGENYH